MTAAFRSFVLLLHIFALGCASSSANDHILPTKEDLLVVGLDKIVPEFGLFEGTMYAGRIPMQNGDRSGELMFWLFAPFHPASTNSIQLWVSAVTEPRLAPTEIILTPCALSVDETL